MKAFDSSQFQLSLPPGHRFPAAKYVRLRERLAAECTELELYLAPPATDGELALAHVPSYVQSMADGSIDPAAMREIGFPWSPTLVERSRRSVGATIAAARAALVGEGVAANMAGGTHHAYAAKGSGFCVFNDVAVAARLMQAEWHRQQIQRRGQGHPDQQAGLKIAVVDLDVHQGNGTASIFQGDASVFTLSLHGARNFPFRKEKSSLDVELPDGCGDDEYLHALDLALETLAGCFEPQCVFYLAGADCLVGDRLGRLKLSFDGMQARDRRVFDWAWQRKLPLVMAMAGGYGVNLEDTVQCQVNSFGVALEYARRWRRWNDWQNQRIA